MSHRHRHFCEKVAHLGGLPFRHERGPRRFHHHHWPWVDHACRLHHFHHHHWPWVEHLLRGLL